MEPAILLMRRAVEFLVEERGFRSLAWDEDWTLGVQINDYIHGQRDDRDALVAQMASPGWRTEEVAGILSWLREYNRDHEDDVDFVGVEYFATWPWPARRPALSGSRVTRCQACDLP
ncbi:MAG: erythromycin esterase family protein [Thermocrispum sp.]